MAPLIDMWVICDVVILIGTISSFDACEFMSSHTILDKNLKQEVEKQLLLKSSCYPGKLSWMNLINKCKAVPILRLLKSNWEPYGFMRDSKKRRAETQPEHSLCRKPVHVCVSHGNQGQTG